MIQLNSENCKKEILSIDTFLSLLKKVKRSGSGWSARCPYHKDQHNSLSVVVGNDNRILLNCHAGCDPEEILGSLGLTWKDVFPESSRNSRNSITVQQLSFAKGIPENFLRSLGVTEKGNALRISYFLEDGTLAARQRKRVALSAKKGSLWEKGKDKPVLYGLWKLKEAREAGWIVFVEGESDCWSAWRHSLPALGFPGADMGKKLEVSYIEGIDKVYAVKEPDQGGENFVKGIRKRLRQLGYTGILFVIEMDTIKDLNELDQKSQNFCDDFTKLIKKAKPLPLVDSNITIDYGDLIPELPIPKDKTVLELMQEAILSKENFAVFAPQGAGKSYANSYIAVDELKKGRSVILFSRSHDELNQLGKTIKNTLRKENLHESCLYHLKGYNEKESKQEAMPYIIPDVRPIIVIAPHVYLGFKGDTPYHYALADMIFQKKLGANPLILIDEMSSFLESCFVSKPLGSRESTKKIFGEELIIRNTLCPLFTHSGNCNNCTGNMSLTLRRGSGGMLEYKPFSQRYQEDKIRKEERKLEYVVWDSKCDDNTMRVYAISAPNNCEKRIWSTGSKDDTQQKLNLQDWYNDIVTRIIEPTMVMFFPYNLETGENLGRFLNESELKDKTRKIIPPRQVCEVPVLQGWDLAILQKMNNSCQIGLTGPGASETERYILKKAINLNKENYYLAKNPYVKFEKVLIIALEKDISGKNFELKSMLKTLTSKTKILYFLPTYLEAKKAERKISKNIATMYYDGEQKISNNPIEGTSIHFDLCISCIHGPLGQGINLGQFKMAIVDTSNERPKCLFAGRPDVKSIHEYILDDVTEKARQAALRILRLAPNDSPDIPRVVLFYGRNAKEVSCRVEKELAQVGHQIKMVEAKECIPYAQDVSLKWLTDGDITDLEKLGLQCYEEKEIVEKAKTEIVNYLQKNPNNNTWRDITRKFRTISELTDTYEKMIKQWFNEYTDANKLDRKLEKILEKIRTYMQENPQAEWRKIYNAFNLSRKTKEETMMIKERLNM